MTAPAVIIPWRDEGDGGESLRYALRSLRNVPHGSVVICGDRAPSWAAVDNVVTERHADRQVDSRNSVLAGMEDGWAYIWDDDVYVVRPVDYIAPAHRGVWNPPRRGDYYNQGIATRNYVAARVPGVLYNYDSHIPLLVHVPTFVDIINEVAAALGGGGIWHRSAYANLARVKGRQIIDPKVAARGTRPNPGWVVWSTSDVAFSRGIAGKMVRQAFPDPGPYEVPSGR